MCNPNKHWCEERKKEYIESNMPDSEYHTTYKEYTDLTHGKSGITRGKK